MDFGGAAKKSILLLLLLLLLLPLLLKLKIPLPNFASPTRIPNPSRGFGVPDLDFGESEIAKKCSHRLQHTDFVRRRRKVKRKDKTSRST